MRRGPGQLRRGRGGQQAGMRLLRLLPLRAGGPGRESAAPSLAGVERRRAGELRGKPGDGGWPSREAGARGNGATRGKGSQGARQARGERPVGAAGWRRPGRRGQSGGRRAGQCCGGLGSGMAGETGLAAGRGLRHGGVCSRYAAGPRGARAGPPAEQSGHGVHVPSRGSCVAAAAGERSGTAESQRQMNREERRELGGESPGDLRGEGKPLYEEEEEEEEEGGR